jgi:hypothetical protein
MTSTAQRTRGFTFLLAAGLVLVGLSTAASAASPDGTWKWTFSRGDQSIDLSLDLKAEGEKLTGKLSMPNGNSVDIKDGSFKNDEVAFTVEFERNGNVRTTKYQGKVDGDTIKGTRESERNGEVQKRDWEATRAK